MLRFLFVGFILLKCALRNLNQPNTSYVRLEIKYSNDFLSAVLPNLQNIEKIEDIVKIK